MPDIERSSRDEPVEVPRTTEGIVIHLSYIRRDLDEIGRKLSAMGTAYVTAVEYQLFKSYVDKNLVSKDQFDPVKRLVYGGLGISATALIGAAVALIFKL